MIMRVRLSAGIEVRECWHTLRPAVNRQGIASRPYTIETRRPDGRAWITFGASPE
jgi:hypothetical protein